MLLIFGLIGLVLVYIAFSFFSNNKNGSKVGSSGNGSCSTSVPKNLSVASLALKTKFKIPDQGGVVTISIPKSLLDEQALLAIADIIAQLLEISTVYLFVECHDDEGEENIRALVAKTLPIFSKHHHLLFHSKNVGKIAFVRQLKPHVHIEYDSEVYDAVVKHVPLAIMQNVSMSIPLFRQSYLHSIQHLNDLRDMKVYN